MPTNWSQVLFGDAPEAATSGGAGARATGSGRARPAYTTQQIRDLITQEAQRQGVDPRLALAVATQESSLNPNAVGDRGKSLGLFQLQPAAAQDAGIDPQRRGEVELNIRGGVTYLKQKLQQSGGHREQALSRYNRGTPTYRGIGDPRYVENVMEHYSRLGGQVRGSPTGPAAAPVAPPAPRDWGQALGLAPATPPPRSAAAAAPAAPRDWGQELFG